MLKFASMMLVVVCACTLVVGQEKEPGGSWGSHTGPEAPAAGEFSIDWPEQARLAEKHVASRAWREAHPDWRVLFDPRTSLPWRAFGPGIQVAPAQGGKEAIELAASSTMEALALASGLDPAGFRFVTAARAGRLWYVDFEQRISGAAVFNGGLTMRIDDGGRLVMWGGRLVHPDFVAPSPTLDAEAAIANAITLLASERFLTGATQIDPPQARLVVHVADERERFAPALAWLVETHTEIPTAVWKIFIDARSGAVLQYWNDVREHGGDEAGCVVARPQPLLYEPLLASFSGVSTGTVHDGVTPQSAAVLRSLNDLYVNCNGTNVLTDAAGMYMFNGGGTTVPVSSGLDGNHVTTNNSAGTQALFSGSGSTGTLDVLWTDTNSQLAERDAFFFTNQAWHNLMLHNPAETLFNTALLANVNVTGTCNAYYTTSPLSINFFPAGGGCINTAYSASVVIHEYGHHVTITIYASHARTIPGGMGEGYADCQSGSALDTNIVGDGFSGPGTMVRNMDNTCQYPASCGTEVHAAGLVIGGCYWHTRVQFANAYGAAGKAMVDDYLYQHFHGTPQNAVEALMEMLLLNDTDANLSNGTPDASKFYQGFTVLHSVPFPIPLIEVTHVPLADTMDQVQDYQVHATASVSAVFPGTIATATLYYSVNGGAYSLVPMTQTGGEYVGAIPVQPVGTTINYFVQFVDSNSHSEKSPASGTHTFHAFRAAQFYFDGFEVASGWVSAAVSGQNDWQNQAPGNPNHAYDPTSAFQGTKCWGNDLSPAGFNGNYQNNVNNNLTSPTINCTGKTGVSIVYRRWLTVEDGVYDHARIRVSNNNGASFVTVWENPAGTGVTHFLDTSWVEHVVDISALADNQPQVKVRYELVTDAGLVFGGWSIDSFSLTSASATLPLTNVGSNTPGGMGAIRISGVAGDGVVLAADLSTSTNFVPGIGTISLDPDSPTLLILFDGSTTIPPAGFFDLTFTVPNASGVTAWFEGALIPTSAQPPLLITNVLPYTIQ